MSHRTWAVGFVAAAVIAFGARSAAADQVKSGSYYKPIGNDLLGGSFQAVGVMSSSRKSSYTYGNVSARVRFFGKSCEAIGATYSSWSNAVTGNAYLVIRMAGYQVYTKKLSATWGKSWNHAGTIAEGSSKFSVFGVPVVVWGSIGGGFQGNLSLIATPTAAGIGGFMHAWARGSAGGQVGWSWLRAGIDAALDVLDTTLTVQMKADFLAVNGLVKISIVPLRIYMGSWVHTVAKDYYWKLVDWASPRTEWLLFER